MNTIVCKFGGSSLASAEQFRKVKEIIQSDPARRYVVASAPGKRNAKDIKITDLLYRACTAAQEGRRNYMRRIREENKLEGPHVRKPDTIVAIGYAERQMATSLKMAGKGKPEV